MLSNEIVDEIDRLRRIAEPRIGDLQGRGSGLVPARLRMSRHASPKDSSPSIPRPPAAPARARLQTPPADRSSAVARTMVRPTSWPNRRYRELPPTPAPFRQHSRERRDRECEKQHGRIERGILQSRHYHRIPVHNHPQPPPCQQQSGNPPPAASTRLSVSACRTSRTRLAPNAIRTATSRRRTAAGTNSRLATLAQAIRSTNATAPNRIRSERPVLPSRRSRSGSPPVPDRRAE